MSSDKELKNRVLSELFLILKKKIFDPSFSKTKVVEMLPFKLVLFLFYFIVLCSPRIRAESATCSEEEKLYDAAKVLSE